MRFRVLVLAAVALVAPVAAQRTPAEEARAAAARALPLLQSSATAFVEARACMSCHHNALAVLTMRHAQGHGLPVDAQALARIEARTFAALDEPGALDDAIQGVGLSDPTPNDSYLLWAADSAARPPDLTSAVVATRITRWQRGDHWDTSDFRPPHSSSAFAATATAIRALRRYVPPSLGKARDQAVQRAAGWLTTTAPRSTEDAAFRVFGLVWAGAPQAARAAAIDDLGSLQSASGGWGHLPGDVPDAYATGEALAALQEAGVPNRDPRVARGLQFLLSTQARDGTWHVPTRMVSPATVSPPYFDTGFPYGKDAFLSYAGTCWAVIALLGPGGAPSVAPPPRTTSAPAWLEPALFGDAADVRARLDAGLDPEGTTPGGTTVLMAAAADADKVRLLLARGAGVARRAPSGVDALTVATTYRGTSAAVALLLAAGAAADPPPERRPPHAPLSYAAMNGDADTVRLLLAAGAKGSSVALPEAITFGHPDVARLLIEAGAAVRIAEPSGVTLLHWAVMTNRPAAVPLLVRAGADVNAVDNAGFTPLMYAATVDHGHTATVEALLAAGADASITNRDGRTALQQAERLGHEDIARALRAR